MCLSGRLRHADETVRLQRGADVKIKIDSPVAFVEAQRTVNPRSLPGVETQLVIFGDTRQKARRGGSIRAHFLEAMVESKLDMALLQERGVALSPSGAQGCNPGSGDAAPTRYAGRGCDHHRGSLGRVLLRPLRADAIQDGGSSRRLGSRVSATSISSIHFS
jgi:hypothetical protein